MRIGTLRDIADLSDQEFALVLQALPAIRQEIQAFNNKIEKVVGVNDCDFATYNFVVNGKNEAQTEFLRWMERTVKEGNVKADKENQTLKNKCDLLEKENSELKKEKRRLENEVIQAKYDKCFQKNYWLQDFCPEKDNLGNYKVTSGADPWTTLIDLVSQSTKGGV